MVTQILTVLILGVLVYLLFAILKKFSQLLGCMQEARADLMVVTEKLTTTLSALTGDNIEEVPVAEIIKETYRRKMILREMFESLEIAVANGVARVLSKVK